MMDALMVYKNRALDWDNSETRASLANSLELWRRA
jgi:hypothetical protein